VLGFFQNYYLVGITDTRSPDDINITLINGSGGWGGLYVKSVMVLD
jgi:hypothetical protein